MKPGTFWTRLIGAIDAFSILPLSNNEEASQVMLSKTPHADVIEALPPGVVIGQAFDDGKSYAAQDGTPIISPPPPPQEHERDRPDIICKYPRMRGWNACQGPNSRDCWLQKFADGKQMDINTNYENKHEVPDGIVRRVRPYAL